MLYKFQRRSRIKKDIYYSNISTTFRMYLNMTFETVFFYIQKKFFVNLLSVKY